MNQIIELDVAWVTLFVAMMTLLMGFVGAYFTLSKLHTARCEKQNHECQVVFARKDVIETQLKSIEEKVIGVGKQVDQIWRQNGFRHD